MSVILILILASLAMALLFLGGFIWAVRAGQFEDTATPALRVLLDEPVHQPVPPPGTPPRREHLRAAKTLTCPENPTLRPRAGANPESQWSKNPATQKT
ncbi:MAG: cbb3-type cytochrome oxidase assembly protein CcoS [Verrucomicrobiae bacterium]|nr:cbb3-type cytochrome oxidase assembly protein CcoS [Verrucomicrobiae bacterium]